MNKINIPIIGAVITALLSTLCCLPAFLFLFFGVSSGVLTALTSLEYLRFPMGILTAILLVYGIKKLSKKVSCECKKQTQISSLLSVTVLFVIVGFLLFYPEIIPMFMD